MWIRRISFKILAVVLIFLAGGIFMAQWALEGARARNQKYWAQRIRQEARGTDLEITILKTYADMLSDDPYVHHILADPETASGEDRWMARRHLGAVAVRPGILGAFLLDAEGTCVLSTQKGLPGKNYAFRPYFKGAMFSGQGFYTSVGVSSDSLDFYFASRVSTGGKAIGVAVIKIARDFFSIVRQGQSATGDRTLHLSRPFNALATEQGIIIGCGPGLYVLGPLSRSIYQPGYLDRHPSGMNPRSVSELYPSDRSNYGISAKGGQGVKQAVGSLGFPAGTWRRLKTRGAIRINNPKYGDFYLEIVPLDVNGLVLFHCMPADMAASFIPASEPVYAIIAAFMVTLVALIVLYQLLISKHAALRVANSRLKDEHQEYSRLFSRYKTLIDATSEGFWIVDAEQLQILEVNDAICRMLDYDRQALIGKTPFDLVDDKNRKILMEQASQKGKDRCLFELELLTRDGQVRYVRISSIKITGQVGEGDLRFAFITDLTDYVRSQQQIRKLSVAVEQSANTVVITNTQGEIEYVNPKFCQVTGYSKDEIMGKNPRLLKSGLQSRGFYQDLWNTISSGAVWKGEFCNKKKNGDVFWESATISPVRDEQGNISHYIAIKEDITDKIRLRTRLEETAAELDLIIENAGIGIAYIKNRRLVRLNSAMARLYGARPDELIGKDTSFIYASMDDYENYGKEIYSRLANGETVVKELPFNRKDGSTIWGRLTGKALDPGDPDGGSIWMLEDITRRKAMEAAMARKDAILEAVSMTSSLLLTGIDWRAAAGQFLSALGGASAVTRASILKLEKNKTGATDINGVAHWASPNVVSSFSDFLDALSDKTVLLQSVLGRLKDGEIEVMYLLLDSPAGIQEEGHPGGIMSSVCLCPIILEGSLWGMLAFENFGNERTWSEAELEAFKVAANVISAAIQREYFELEKRLEEFKFTTIISNANSIILRVDASGRVLFLNRFGLEFFGYTEDDIRGEEAIGTIFPEGEGVASALRRLIEDPHPPSGDYYSSEGESIRGDGRHVWISWTNTPITDSNGRLKEVLSIGHDLTRQKEIEKRLREASEAKSRFVANMSHEIRTPLNAVIGMADLVMKTRLDPVQKQYVSAIQAGANTLLSLINNILDFSKIEAGQMVLERKVFELDKVMEESVRIIAAKAHAKDLEILCHWEPDVPLKLVGDELRLSQIFLNLMGNSVKFTEVGDVVLDCSLEGIEDDIAILHFRVIDTGIGIPEGEQKNIFEPFTQADTSVTRRFGGTGLGLSLCMRLAKLMDGGLWVESTEGMGTTFHLRLRLPRAQDISDMSLPDGIAPMDWPVLVVSPNHWLRLVIKDLLVPYGFPVTGMGDPAVIANFLSGDLKGCRARLIFIDEVVTETASVVYADQGGRSPHLILLDKAFAGGPDSTAGGDSGFIQCLHKPVFKAQLLNIVSQIILGKPFLEPGIDLRLDIAGRASGRLSARVLLVEDNELNQQLAMAILSNAGHEFSLAADGLDALEQLSKETFDLVLMDVQMPRMDGILATRVIRAVEAGREPAGAGQLSRKLLDGLKRNLAGKHIPIIAMTAHAFLEDRDNCMAAGMDDYLTKPFKPKEINQVIAWSLNQGESHTGKHLPDQSPYKEAGKARAVRQELDMEAVKRYLVETFGLTPEEMEGMLETISLSLEPVLEKGKDAAISGRHLELSEAAHSIKGILLNLGLEELAEKALQIEVNSRKQAAFPYQQAFFELEDRLRPLL